MTHRSRSAAVLLLLAALVSGACGGGVDARTAFLAGIDAVADESTAYVVFETSTTLPDGTEVTASGEGPQAMDGSAAELTVETAFGGQSFTMTTRLLDTDVYLTGGPFDQLLGPGTWVVLTADDIEQAAGIDMSQIVQSAQQARSALEQLRGITEESFEVVGEEEVDGVVATHFSGTVDMDAALAAMDPETADALAAVSEMLPDEVDVDVWMDDEDRPVKVVTDAEVTVQGQSLQTTTTLRFRDWGLDVDVEAPEDTVTFNELMNGLGGLGG